MAADAIKFNQRCVVADCSKALCQIPLLLNRKEDIGLDTYNEYTLELQAFETGLQRATVLGEIEQV